MQKAFWRHGLKVKSKNFGITLAVLVLSAAGFVSARLPRQALAQTANQGQAAAAGRVGAPAYPAPPPADPAKVARGKQVFSVNCSFCHGSDATGGEGGPNLIRSELVLDDKNGELIGQVVLNGRPDKGMPKFDLTAENISDIAAFVHNFPVGGKVSRGLLTNSLVGDPKAGEIYFNGPGKCNTCHSVTGDLAGIGTKYTPIPLQGALLTGGAGGGRGAVVSSAVPPNTVTVTLPGGTKVEGKLERIDDFNVSLVDAAGNHLNYERNGDIPKVEIHDPMKVHRDMLRVYTDTDIHNLTAYLATLK